MLTALFVGVEFIQSVAAISDRWAEGDGSEQKLTKSKKETEGGG